MCKWPISKKRLLLLLRDIFCHRFLKIKNNITEIIDIHSKKIAEAHKPVTILSAALQKTSSGGPRQESGVTRFLDHKGMNKCSLHRIMAEKICTSRPKRDRDAVFQEGKKRSRCILMQQMA